MPDQDNKPAADGATPGQRVDYPHDENYRPGYHEGGSRFGFFNGEDDAKPPEGGQTPEKP